MKQLDFTKHYRAADGGQPACSYQSEKLMIILFIICSSFVFGDQQIELKDVV
jgi:hypothetical protein